MTTAAKSSNPSAPPGENARGPGREEIIDYYLQTERHYRAMWGLERNMALHYGHWSGGVRTHSEALLNMNREMARRAQISSADTVLDAGCGVGGTAVYLAKTLGCRVVGLNLVDRQLRMAVQNARRHGVADRVHFIRGNFLETAFASESFSVVLFLESSCHAGDSTGLMREARRILQPGGRAVAAAYFKSDRPLSEREERYLRFWQEAWSMAPLPTISQFLAALERAGFSGVVETDETSAIAPSARRMYYLSYLGLAIKAVRRLWRTSTPRKLRHVWAARVQETARRKGLWSYRIVAGLK